MKKKTAVIVQSEVPEEVVEKPVLAQAIISISDSFKSLSRQGISKRAIGLLVQDNCRGIRNGRHYGAKPTLANVLSVIESLESLKATYVR